jgi:prepilin-type processing-associated H-X9-DG protein
VIAKQLILMLPSGLDTTGGIMSRRVVIVGVTLAIVLGVGLLIPFINKTRLHANRLASQNNLKQLALFAFYHSNPDPQRPLTNLPLSIPAGTVVLAGVLPENRLSWALALLPGVDQHKNPVELVLQQVDQTQPWLAEPNQQVSRQQLAVFICPENPPTVPAGEPAITCYVGIAGLGRDAATLLLPEGRPTPARAGAFRYDALTPFDRITDGLSQTLLFSETALEPGPWLRGGTATVRGFDDTISAPPLLGTGGQFGGFFPTGANMAFCDGSVRFFTLQTSHGVLHNLATIAGGEQEPWPGD